jgi:hypothetical protein
VTDFKIVADRLLRNVGNNAPTVLSLLAVGGVVTTVILAVRATPEANQAVLNEKDRRVEDEFAPPVNKMDVVKIVWRPYLPAAVSGLLTCGAIVAANRISTKRAAALAAGLTITEKLYSEYKDQVIEAVGKPAEEKIRAKVAERMYERDGLGNKEVIIAENEQLFYDSFSGRTFKSTVETVRRAMNDINAMINNASYASMNDFYRKIGLAATTSGEELGWNGDNMLDVVFSSIVTQGVACMSIDYTFAPVRNYHKIW